MKFIDSFNPFTHDPLVDPETKKERQKVAVAAAVGIVAWFLKPKTEKKSDDSSKPSTTASSTESKSTEDEEKPEIALKETEERAKKVDDLYAKYKSAPDDAGKKRYADQLKSLFMEATAIHESGGHLEPINMKAIVYDKVEKDSETGVEVTRTNRLGKQLKELGVTPSPFILNGSFSLLEGTKHLSSYDAFKNRVCDKLQPGVKDPERVNNTAEILARSAVGKYQILPIYHFDGIGLTYKGEEGLKNIFKFLQSEEMQSKAAGNLTEQLGKRYDWNYMYMAAAYYGGTTAGDRLRDTPKDPSLTREQANGYGSIAKYAKSATALMNRVLARS